MSDFLLYLLEASLLLALLYGAYRLLLSKETFFGFNRFFLIGILVLSLVFPLISFELFNTEEGFINQQVTEIGKARNVYHSNFDNWSGWIVNSPELEESAWQQFWSQDWSWSRVLMVLTVSLYAVGVAYQIFKLVKGYLSIFNLKNRLSLTDFEGVNVAEVPAHMGPFSFLNTVFIPENVEDVSDYSQILAHERTHIKQKHSIDLILVQLAAALLWFNPVVWLLIKSLKQTHEFIADKNMLLQGFSRVEYQALLLRQLINRNSYDLAHNFNLSFIKKRIAMMSNERPGWKGWSKAVLALICIGLVGLLTAQSNRLPLESAMPAKQPQKAKMLDIQFFIDAAPLRDGLQYLNTSNHSGEFRFELDNQQEDEIHVGLDLLREGEIVAHTSAWMKEGASFKIKELLNKAERDDYLVIDVMDGPADASKLYNVPLFRESAAWKERSAGELPPPPVALHINGSIVDTRVGVSLADLKAERLDYVISEFVDFRVLSRQKGDVRITLMRNGTAMKSVINKKVRRKSVIQLGGLVDAAQKGDEILIQFGRPQGLRFGTRFSVK